MPKPAISQFPQIMPVIEAYLDDCKKSGKPMRINIWDTKHFDNGPVNFVADEGLHALAQKYGSPFYVLEDLGSSYWTNILDKYLHGSTEESAQIAQGLNAPGQNRSIMSRKKIFEYAKKDQESGNPKATRIIFPDTREKEIEAVVATLSPAELAIGEKISRNIETEIKRRIAAGKTVTPEIINNEIKPRSWEALKGQDKIVAAQYRKKISPLIEGGDDFDTSIIDAKIAAKTNAAYKSGDVQITLYGAGHFTKKMDLDERMPGLSLAIYDNDKSRTMLKSLFTDGKTHKTHNQFPDYVFYSDKGKMVKLDNDAARAEFIGLSDKQFKTWKLNREIDEGQIRLPASHSNNFLIIPAGGLPISSQLRR